MDNRTNQLLPIAAILKGIALKAALNECSHPNRPTHAQYCPHCLQILSIKNAQSPQAISDFLSLASQMGATFKEKSNV